MAIRIMVFEKKWYIVESKEDSGEVICLTYWDRGKQSDAEKRKGKEES
jgi:hypothetical protein